MIKIFEVQTYDYDKERLLITAGFAYIINPYMITDVKKINTDYVYVTIGCKEQYIIRQTDLDKMCKIVDLRLS